jgi:hypothetical protein
MGWSGRAAHDAYISEPRYGHPNLWRRLKQVVADEFEGVLAGPPADAVAIAGQVEFFDLRVLCIG